MIILDTSLGVAMKQFALCLLLVPVSLTVIGLLVTYVLDSGPRATRLYVVASIIMTSVHVALLVIGPGTWLDAVVEIPMGMMEVGVMGFPFAFLFGLPLLATAFLLLAPLYRAGRVDPPVGPRQTRVE
jgi:hypothetical protein